MKLKNSIILPIIIGLSSCDYENIPTYTCQFYMTDIDNTNHVSSFYDSCNKHKIYDTIIPEPPVYVIHNIQLMYELKKSK